MKLSPQAQYVSALAHIHERNSRPEIGLKPEQAEAHRALAERMMREVMGDDGYISFIMDRTVPPHFAL